MSQRTENSIGGSPIKPKVLSHNPFSKMCSPPPPVPQEQTQFQASQQNESQQRPNIASSLQQALLATPQLSSLAVPHAGTRAVEGGAFPVSSRGVSIGGQSTASTSLDGSEFKSQRISQFAQLLKKEPPEFLRSTPMRARLSRPATPLDNISEASGLGPHASGTDPRIRQFDMGTPNKQDPSRPFSYERAGGPLQQGRASGIPLSTLAPQFPKENSSTFSIASSISADAPHAVSTTSANILLRPLLPSALKQQQQKGENCSRPHEAPRTSSLNECDGASEMMPPPDSSSVRSVRTSVNPLGDEFQMPKYGEAQPVESKGTAVAPPPPPPPPPPPTTTTTTTTTATTTTITSMPNPVAEISSVQPFGAGEGTASASTLRPAQRHVELHTPQNDGLHYNSNYNNNGNSESRASELNGGLTQIPRVSLSPRGGVVEESPSPLPPSRLGSHDGAAFLSTSDMAIPQLSAAKPRVDAQAAPPQHKRRVRCIAFFAAGGRVVMLRDTVLRGTTVTTALTGSEYMTALQTVTTATPQEAVQRMPGVAPLLRELLALMLREPHFSWRTTGQKKLIALLGAAVVERAAPSIGNESGEEQCSGTHLLGPRPACGVDAAAAAAGLREVQLRLCAGERESAVEAALHHRLYAHAIIIAMMCPKKENYMEVIRAVVDGELDSTSPLAHAYCMFNELPLPPFTTSTPPGDTDPLTHSKDKGKAKRNPDILLRTMWAQQAAILIANFTKESSVGLIQLGDALVEEQMLDEAQCCFLLAHLSPLGTQQLGHPLHPRQQHVMDLLRARLGIVGGRYHPRGSRTAFVSPKSTVLTDILQGIRARLGEERDKESAGDEKKSVEEKQHQESWHGLPQCPERYRVAFRYMQVLWMREVGMIVEADKIMASVTAAAPEPSRDVQHSSLNRLIAYQNATLFKTASEARAQQVPSKDNSLNAPPSVSLPTQSHLPPMESTTGPSSLTTALAASITDPLTPDPASLLPCTSSMSSLSAGGTLPPPSAPSSLPRASLLTNSLSAELSLTDSSLAISGAAATPSLMSLTMPLPPSAERTLNPTTAPSRSGPVPTGPPPRQVKSAPLQREAPPPPPPKNALAGSSQTLVHGTGLPPPPPQPKFEQRNGTRMHGNPPPPPPPPPSSSENEQKKEHQQHKRNSSMRSAEAHAALKPPPPKAPSPEVSPEANKSSETNPSTQRTRGRTEESQSQPGRRSRSLDVITGFFFRRSKSRDTKKDEAKNMIIDTEKPPKFDPVTGRYLFEETEEEKKAAEIIKAGPPLPSAVKAQSGASTQKPPCPLRPPGGPVRGGSAIQPRAQYVDMFNS